MKKFLATLSLGALAAVSAFGFAACGENNGETSSDGKIKYTVTEKEWREAITSLYDGEHSVECRAVERREYEDGGWKEEEFFARHDATSHAFYHMQTYVITDEKPDFDDENYGVLEDFYFWKDGDKYYLNWNDGYGAEITSEEKFYNELRYYTLYSFFGNPIEEHKFSELTFDKEKQEYKGSYDGDEEYTYTMKFENGKLVKAVGVVDYGDNSCRTYSFEYKYDNVKVTVPDEMKVVKEK